MILRFMILPATIKGKPMDPAASSTKATHVKHLKYVIWKFVVSQNARTRKYHGEMSILSSSKQPAGVCFDVVCCTFEKALLGAGVAFRDVVLQTFSFNFAACF